MDDVVVVGAGPAGRALARACCDLGLRTALVDPVPERPWHQIYGTWADELPGDVPDDVLAARGRGIAAARTVHELDREYVVFDTAALRGHLDDPRATVHRGAVRATLPGRPGPPAGGVVLADGSPVPAAVVVDASGQRQVLGGLGRARGAGPAAEQTAFGVVVHRDAARAVTGGRLVFMDWRPAGRAPWPTFLYAIPLDGDRVLLEETSLARRPGLGLGVLRERLRERLAAAGLPATTVPDGGSDRRRSVTERVRFPVDTPRHRGTGVAAFGAAAPLVHPASGFSVATALRLAPAVAAAVSTGLGSGPAVALAAARRAVWPPSALAVHAARRRGLEVLLGLPPPAVPEFFESFFRLPVRHQRAYLGAREEPGASLAAMLALFAELPPSLRVALVRGVLGGTHRQGPS